MRMLERPHFNPFKGWLALGVGLVMLAAALAVFYAAGHTNSTARAETETQSTPLYASLQASYADVVARVSPTVVTIRPERRSRSPQQFPFLDDPFFREFFGQRGQRQQPEERRTEGIGSGVIVRADGYILTNHHVIDGAEAIKVDLNDRRTYTARVIGSDPPSDLAVLKIDANNLPVLTLGDSDKVRVGDVVLAIGNPLGVGQTVTMGIVSAKGRSTRGPGDGSFEDFLQTDAPINRGNSGGALVGANGELVGINSQILSPSGGNIGIGFAIPANMARSVMEQLIQDGRVRRGLLGVSIQSITSDIAASINLSEPRGALISGVQPGSPADRSGLRRGDIVTALNGVPIEDSNQLRNLVARTQPGTVVTLTYVRAGREHQTRATLAELPSTPSAATESDSPERRGTEAGRLGLRLEPLTPELVARLGAPRGTTGLAVASVDPSGPAARTGIREGDIIEEVNNQPVRSIAEFAATVQRAGQRPVLLLINRRGDSIYLAVRPQG